MTSCPHISTGSYEKWRSSTLGEITEALEDDLLLELLGNIAGRRVLDVGCGDGTFALKLHAQGAEVFGVDPDKTMIEAAQQRFRHAGATISLAEAEGEHLPFADATFDVVMAKTVLCFVTEATAMVGEMARVLRPDGRFVIGELGRWSLWAAQRRMRGWLGSSLWRNGRFRTPDELRGLAASAGLSVGQLRGAVYYPRVTWAARLLASRDAWFGHLTTYGAAFLALSATKSRVAVEEVAARLLCAG